MSRRQCGTCNIWTHIDYLTQYGDCKTCVAMKEKLEEKLGEEVYDWIMQLIEGKMERAIDQHERRCEHELYRGY